MRIYGCYNCGHVYFVKSIGSTIVIAVFGMACEKHTNQYNKAGTYIREYQLSFRRRIK